ncbi:MAG TPA: hypothetical protein VFO30_06520 [Chthoniobacterales bacterium]|nr:hypothetical protein [Chthoniobacterales bacterium]
MNAVKMRVLVVCALLVGGASGALTETRTPDPEWYGPYPANYKEIVTKWLETQLLDPTSARIEWKDEPKPADLGSKGEHLYGYLVTFTVNARNRFGTYTGKQVHGALIRNGEVIKGVGFGY